MPNFLTVQNEAEVKPLGWKGKFAITADGAFDPYEFFVAGVVSGIRQAENAYPGFGQGFVGYGKRYGTAMADQVDANMMVGAVFPTILKTDPRYFQLGRGSFSHRFGYALSRIFITRKDSGGSTFNFSEPVGNGVAIGISNLYYPASNRSVFEQHQRLGPPDGHRRLRQRTKGILARHPPLHREAPPRFRIRRNPLTSNSSAVSAAQAFILSYVRAPLRV